MNYLNIIALRYAAHNVFELTFISKSLHVYFNLSQDVSPFLLVNSLVIVANEGSIVCKCFEPGKLGWYLV